ncbi:sugar ABC transporter substrate-binding protein [Salibacterium salarium]|uniref:Sugar ABC transporter substrate-binding protein n=1 Tax=Salibacterium salarium TaxID=284579 RepID=A0A3R9QUS8_9BACI|nr:sugar ABC transporter substrate-binding protein [Salibacterium salarium]RSL33903.1 sugar ABC transporter substrate-binding protein [Salibacterium salarium]
MKKFHYSFITVLLGLTMSLAACGGSGDSGEDALPDDSGGSNEAASSDNGNGGEASEEENNDDTVDTGEVETSVEATGDEDTVLEFWIHQTGEDETNAYIERIDAFNEEHDNIHVEAEVIIDDGASAYSDSINAALVAGNLPDVMAIDGPYISSFADAGVIQPVDDYIDEETKDEYVNSIIEQGTYQDELYSLGAMEASVMLFYNKDILEEEGIEPASSLDEAWTWDELMENSKQLTTDDRYGLNLFMNEGVGEWMTFMGAPLLWSNGGALIADDGSTSDGYLNSPESIEAFEYVESLFEEGVVSESPSQTQFEEEEAALALGGPWIAISAEEAGLNWGMMPYPYVGEQVSPSGSMAYAVTSNAENPEAAAELMTWMTNEESSTAVAEVTGMPPGNANAFESMEKFDEEPWSIMKEQVLETAKARPTTPAYPVVTDAFAQTFHAAVLGEDIEEIADQQVSRVERELRKFD